MHCFVYYIYNAFCIWFISCFFFFSFISNNFSACWRQLCSLFQHLWFQSAWLSSTPKWIVRANPPCRLAGPQCWHLSHVFVNCQLESSLYSFLIKLGNNFHRESGSRHEVDWRERGGGECSMIVSLGNGVTFLLQSETHNRIVECMTSSMLDWKI